MLIKKSEEIQIIAEGGKILTKILKKVLSQVKPGVNTKDLEEIAVVEIAKAGGRPAFKDYPMGGDLFFPSALCTSINEEVVHGPAVPGRVLNSGDILSVDIGMEWPYKKGSKWQGRNFPINPHSEGGGYFTDMARTVAVGKISSEAHKLLKTTNKCLEAGIAQAKVGNSLNDIGKAIENIASKAGFGIVRDMVGHGVGYQAHEAPDIYHYAIGENSLLNQKLKEGMVIAIEPMITEGTWKITEGDNDFSIITADRKLSAHFENTITIAKNGPKILTKI
ncbi:MAG: type I methionyl aminopeptidase [Candidatus Pacebacteria bacterium]|nr:type I methionyl aminopeptidase [Candidatus Paceibacterota bacterium]